MRFSVERWDAELTALEEILGENSNQLASTPTLLPLRAERMTVSADFGNRVDPVTNTVGFQSGILIAARPGGRVIAPADGRVAFTGQFRSRAGGWQRFGRIVVIRHGERFISVLGHCGRIRVNRGERVRRGDWVADSGDSGLPPHPGLYYELRWRDRSKPVSEAWIPVDPKFYVLDYTWVGEEAWRARGSAQRASDYDAMPYALRR